MREHWNRRYRRWAVAALSASVLAGCTTYKPLDGGSQVPWAGQARAPQAALASRSVVSSELPPIEPRREPVRLGPAPAPQPVAKRTEPVVEPAIAPPERSADVAAVRVQPPVATSKAEAPAAAGGATQHRVASGDRLGAVAEAYGVSLEAMAEVNGLSAPYVIYVGQVLQVPAGAAAAPVRYVVRRGDTISGIARRFDVAMADVAASNGIRSPYRLSVGQSLEIPGVQTAKAVPDAAPPALTGRGFLWPVSGKLIGGFGATASGQHRNGINIAARKGAPVVASEDGIVVYASDGIDGYGRMVLVRHAEGYITTYAHNAALLVEVGDLVRRGQVIARVGDTGDVSTSQLHFELRRGTKPINPEAVLVRDSTAVASTS